MTSNDIVRAAIVGCGIIGKKRAHSLPPNCKLTCCFDTDLEKGMSFSKEFDIPFVDSLEKIMAMPNLNAIFIATINSSLAPTIMSATKAGLHILVEKPAARSYQELLSCRIPDSLLFKVGFNHRFHQAFIDLRMEIDKFPNDPILFIRAQYGNGARLGFQNEWRSKLSLAGGGELLDQGVHLLDLASCLIPKLKVDAGICKNLFWNSEVDDNTWAVLSNADNQTFSFHVSSTEWKNDFRFEVYTRTRKLQWIGLGGSYGPETLIIHTMPPEMGPPQTRSLSYPAQDQSWNLETKNFIDAIQKKSTLYGGYEDALKSLQLVAEIYNASKLNQTSLKHPLWHEN